MSTPTPTPLPSPSESPRPSFNGSESTASPSPAVFIELVNYGNGSETPTNKCGIQEVEIDCSLKMSQEDSFSTDQPEIAKKMGVWGSVFSYVCACVGAGILNLPSSLQKCGWLGLLVMVIVAVFSDQTAKYIMACMFAKPGKILRTYEDIGEEAMGLVGRRLVTLFQLITLYGVCTIFLIISGGNMTTLVPDLTLHTWVFIFGGVMIPIAWLKTMNEVVYLAVFGVIASFYVGGIVIVKGFTRITTPGVEIHYELFDINGLATAINIIAFSFSGHSILPNIVSHLHRPEENYKKVSSYSYVLIAGIYMLTAAGGYSGWGRDVKENILNNMDEGLAIVKLALAGITAHVVLTYPLPMNPVSLQMESIFGIDKLTGMKELIMRCLLRTCLVLITIFIASVVPYFGDILSLVSSLSIVVVMFIFPPLFYYLLYRHTKKFTYFELVSMFVIAAFGVAASVIGIYYAIKSLLNSIENNPNPFDNYF